jgi:hypothetical protein
MICLITVITGIILLIWYYRKKVALIPKEDTNSRKIAVNKFRITLIGTFIVIYALISSYGAFFTRIKNLTNAWSLITSSVLFTLLFFINILLLSWAFSLLSSIFNPDRIAEFGAKFFGFEVSQKYLPVKIQEDLEKVDLQLKNYC